MRLKKLICTGLALIMFVSAAGCGGATGAITGDSAPAAAESGTDTASGQATDAKDAAAAETPAASAGTETAAAGTAAAASGEISQDDISVTWEDSRVYAELTLGRYTEIVTYGVKGYEDVPFIKASDYLDILYQGKEDISIENGVMTVSVNGTKAVLDPEADTITFDNSSALRASGEIDGPVVDKVEWNVVTVSTKNKSTQTAAKPVVISLKDYHMPMVAYEDDILTPFLALQNTFGAAMMNTVLAYNGKDYYNVFEASNFALDEEHKNAKESAYYKAIYNGPFSTMKETTQAYADYGYYSVCLLLDMTFGHKEEKNITTFDEYLTRLNAKNAMCSTKPSAAVTAELLLFDYLFDTGHDALISTDSVFGDAVNASKEEVEGIVDEIKESEEGSEIFEEGSSTEGDLGLDVILGALFEKGFKVPEILSLLLWSSYFGDTRPEEYKECRLDYAGDTAVIFFRSFKDDYKRDPSFYLDPVKEEDSKTSNFAFFYSCFEDIKTHDEVKNVVINVADNGGGNATGLISVLGFLSKDGEVKFTDLDIMSGSYREECYHIDTNLDGIPDDQDGYGDQYDFYIMCSGSSYSCANALPYFAQQSGDAKIIGTNPGGGDCVVGYFTDAYGRCACYSGMLKLGKEENGVFVSDEKATTVDLNMMPELWDIRNVPWYDPEGIADAIHQYQNGVTELDYGTPSEQKMSEFFEWLFEEIQKRKDQQGEQAEQDAAA